MGTLGRLCLKPDLFVLGCVSLATYPADTPRRPAPCGLDLGLHGPARRARTRSLALGSQSHEIASIVTVSTLEMSRREEAVVVRVHRPERARAGNRRRATPGAPASTASASACLRRGVLRLYH